MARSRRAGASSPATAPSRERTSASDRALGSPAGTRGGPTSSAGLPSTSPSSSRNRCSERTATRARATDDGARRAARRKAT